jgi:hypothetical protein
MIARKAIASHFPRQDVAEMVIMTQRNVKEQLANAAIFTIKGAEMEEGFSFQLWVPNVKDPEQAKMIKEFVEGERVLQQVNFSEVVLGMTVLIWGKYEEDEKLEASLDAEDSTYRSIKDHPF